MTRCSLLVFAAIPCFGLASVCASPISYELPPEVAAFKPGPNLDVVMNNCTGCHSVDYIATQPRGPKFKEDSWKAEVNKMIKVYGAPVADADVLLFGADLWMSWVWSATAAVISLRSTFLRLHHER
jgi:sulfite dehydrogenase (cytochrome) subunit B